MTEKCGDRGSRARLAEPLHDCENRGVDKPDPKVDVLVEQRSDTLVVARFEILDPEDTRDYLRQEAGQCVASNPLVEPVVELGGSERPRLSWAELLLQRV